jgi:hypothetical protein
MSGWSEHWRNNAVEGLTMPFGLDFSPFACVFLIGFPEEYEKISHMLRL